MRLSALATLLAFSLTSVACAETTPRPDVGKMALNEGAASLYTCGSSSLEARRVGYDEWRIVGCDDEVTVKCVTVTRYDRAETVECTANPVVHGKKKPPSDVAEASSSDDAAAVVTAEDADPVKTEAKTALAIIRYDDCGGAGEGKLNITFGADGTPTKIGIMSGNFDAKTAACIVKRFSMIRLPAFDGEPRSFSWSLDIT